MWAFKILIPIAFLNVVSWSGPSFVTPFVYERAPQITILLAILANIIFWPPHDRSLKPIRLNWKNPADKPEIIIQIIAHLVLAGLALLLVFFPGKGIWRGPLMN